MSIKTIVIFLFIIAAILEFVKVERKSLQISLRKDFTSNLSGTIFGLIALIIWLFG